MGTSQRVGCEVWAEVWVGVGCEGGLTYISAQKFFQVERKDPPSNQPHQDLLITRSQPIPMDHPTKYTISLPSQAKSWIIS